MLTCSNPVFEQANPMSFFHFFHKLSFALVPGTCVLCGDMTERQLDLCHACERDLPWLEAACPRCSQPGIEEVCGRCITDPPPFKSCLAAFEYQYPVDTLIKRFKQQSAMDYGVILAHLTSALASAVSVDLLVPVPLHWRKSRRRGFNQATLLAARISQDTGIALADVCRCRYRAADQRDLNVDERERNVRGVFACTADLSGQRVLIVDDVVTTTATVRELSRVLLACGATECSVLCVARTG